MFSQGDSVGNLIADRMSWERDFFHKVYEKGLVAMGVGTPPLSMLEGMGKYNMPIDDLCLHLAPLLELGLFRFEKKFGSENVPLHAWSTVKEMIEMSRLAGWIA